MGTRVSHGHTIVTPTAESYRHYQARPADPSHAKTRANSQNCLFSAFDKKPSNAGKRRQPQPTIRHGWRQRPGSGRRAAREIPAVTSM